MDAACGSCSVAVWSCGRTIAAEQVAAERGHAEILMPMLTRTLGMADIQFSEITGLAVTVGPGSFTGIRIAIATARGLSLALGRPVVGVTTLEAIAHAARLSPPAGSMPASCVVALDTRRADLYVQSFAPHGAPTTPPACAMPQDVAAEVKGRDVLVAGNAAEKLLPLLHERGLRAVRAGGDGNPDARVVAQIAASRLAGGGAERFPAMPVYLRAPDAIKPANRGRLQR